MRISVLVLTVLTAVAFSASWSLGPGGLSGWPGLPCSDILESSLLRAGVSFKYIETDNGSILQIPLKACWGIEENFEVGAVVPVVPIDGSFDGSIIGDIILSGGWLYEKARGGTALKFTGRIVLPTGEESRDSGAELAIGGVTSTTFLDFRLSMSAEYALNGGRNPANDTIKDVMYFTAGGSSFITSDLLLHSEMKGSTFSELGIGAGVQYLLNDEFALDGGINAAIKGYDNFTIYTGLCWTGSGF